MQSLYTPSPADRAVFYKNGFGMKEPTKVDMPLEKNNLKNYSY